MQTYIEVSFITNLLLGLMSEYASGCFALISFQHRYIIVWLFFEQLLLMTTFYFDTTFLFFCFELFFYLFAFYLQYKRMLLFICIRYLTYATLMKFLSGSFHLGHYFVPLHCQMYGIWLLMAFGIFLLKQKWEAFLLVSEFIFPVVIYSEVPFCIKGFLDSGNQVILDDYPVLFLDQSYTKKMDAHKKKECKVVTLNKQEVLTCYLYEVKIGRNKKKPCYICCDKRVILEWGCVCLLNLHS